MENDRALRSRFFLHRRPNDLIYLFLGILVLVFSVSLARTNDLTTFEVDLFRLFNHLPNSASLPLLVTMQIGTLAAVFAISLIALLYRRHLSLKLFLGGSLAWGMAKIVKIYVARFRPHLLLNNVIVRETGLSPFGFPSGHMTVATALATIILPHLRSKWHRLIWMLVILTGVARIYVGGHLPIDIIGGFALGWIIGTAINLIFGLQRERTSFKVIKEALTKVGLHPSEIRLARVDARGSIPFIIKSKKWPDLFVKAIGGEERTADWLFKIGRHLLFQKLEDETPFITPKQQLEHEFFLTLLAERGGVNTPHIIFTTQTKDGTYLLVEEKIEGKELDALERKKINSQLLEAIWLQVKLLHQARIAHRDLRKANFLIDSQGKPWLIDFGFAEAGASERQFSQDIAEMLVSLSLVAKTQKTIKTAIKVLGKKPLIKALPFIQPLSLSSATRKELRDQPQLIETLRGSIAQQLGISLPPVVPLTRIRRTHLFWLLIFALAIHLLLPQLGELEKSLIVIRNAHWQWLILAWMSSLLTIFMATISLSGAIGQPIALGQTFLAQLGAVFINHTTPYGLGGMTLIERYLEKLGYERPVAVSAVGLTWSSGFLVFLFNSLIALIIFGQFERAVLKLPVGWPWLILLILLLIAFGFFFFAASFRQKLLSPIKQSLRALKKMLTNPSSLIKLFGGAWGSFLADFLTFFLCLRAFGDHLALGKILVVFLGSAVIGTASPTPNGLGAIEAALVIGLTALGSEPEKAIAGVLTFRFLTFWLPMLPGYFSFRLLSKKKLF